MRAWFGESRRVLTVAVMVLCATCPNDAAAFARLTHATALEWAQGVRAPLGRAALCRSSLSVSEFQLFGIPELRLRSVRARTPLGPVTAGVSWAQLSAPVGTERSAETSLALASARVSVSISAGADRAHVRGAFPVELYYLSGCAGATVSDGLQLFSRADRIRLGGETMPGADVWLGVHAFVAPGASLVAAIRFDRFRGAAPVMSARYRPAGWFAATAGYDHSTTASSAALVFSLGFTSVEVAAQVHSVLGMSQGITVSWSG